jgi:hypothetical protein
LQRRWVPTVFGWQPRWINVCSWPYY